MHQLYVYIHPLPLGPPQHQSHPSRSSQSTKLSSCTIQHPPTSYLSYTWLCIYVNASLPTHPPLWVHTSVLDDEASVPALKIVYLQHFFRFHIYVLTYNICFCLSDLFQLGKTLFDIHHSKKIFSDPPPRVMPSFY